MKKSIYLITALLFAVLFTTTINAQQKYAVLICGETPTGGGTGTSWEIANPQQTDDPDYDEFWNDTYLMWEMLIEKGYDNDNIFVLFNDTPEDWSDPLLLHDVANRYNPRWQYPLIIDNDEHIADYGATEANVTMVLNGLANGNIWQGIPQLTENDFLFVWAFSHGGITTPGHSNIILKSGALSDGEFYDLVQPINCDKKVLLFQQCFSGPFANNFVNESDVFALSAANDTMSAHGVDNHFYDALYFPGDPNPGTMYNAYEEDIWVTPLGMNHEHTHAEFNLHILNSIMGVTPSENTEYEIIGFQNPNLADADTDNDNLTSMLEAYNWNWDYNSHFYTQSGNSYDDPQLHDPNIGNITSIQYPTIIHNDVNSNISENGIIGIPIDVHVLQGNTLTFTGASVFLDFDGDLYVDAGATLIIDDNVVIQSVVGTRKIVVDGNIQIGNNVSFIAEEGSQLQVIINNSNIDVTFSSTQFTGTGLVAYNNLTTVTNSTFTNSGLYGFNGDFNISNSSFNNSFVNIRNANTNDRYVNITNQCSFTALNFGYSILIDNYPNFNISSNNIINGSSGLYIANSGYGKSDNIIIGNIISNNSATGITLYNSVTEIRDNIVCNNQIGVKLYNNTETIIEGNDQVLTQEISNNSSYQLYITQGSFPHVMRYNKVLDDNNTVCWMKYTGLEEGLDVRYNNWGSNYIPYNNLCPNGAYIIEPIWEPTFNFNILEVETMFISATDKIVVEDYTGAKEEFQQIITQYPDTKFAQASLKELVNIEEYAGNDFNGLKSYYDTDPSIQNNTELLKLADFLANRCNLKLENWSDAITWFENVIQNPEAFEDSIFAIVDLGYTYWLMENSEMKSSTYVGSMAQYKFTTHEAFDENRDYLFSLLPGDELNLTKLMQNKVETLSTGELLQNIPNPFNGKTNIFYKLENEALVTLIIYDYTGKLIETYNEGIKPEGVHNVMFDSKRLPSGMYFCSLEINGIKTNTKKMIVK